MYDILQLNEMLVPELKQVAEQLDIDGFKKLTKQELIYKILDQQAISGASEEEERKKEAYFQLIRRKKREGTSDKQ